MSIESDFEFACETPMSVQAVKFILNERTIYVLFEYFYNKVDEYEFYRISVQPTFIVTRDKYGEYKKEFNKSPQGRWANKFQVVIDNTEKTVKFGPTGNIILHGDFRSFGIGTYCMSKLIEIVQLRFNDYRVLKGELGVGDAQADNKDRRNNFYKNLFESVVFYDSNKAKGSFGASNVSKLKTHYSTRVQIEEIDCFKYIKEHFELEKTIKKKDEQIKRLLKSNDNNLDEITDLFRFKLKTYFILAVVIVIGTVFYIF